MIREKTDMGLQPMAGFTHLPTYKRLAPNSERVYRSMFDFNHSAIQTLFKYRKIQIENQIRTDFIYIEQQLKQDAESIGKV